MTPPRYYSVSPLYSFCTVNSRSPTFAETIMVIWRWWHRRDVLSLKDRIRQRQVIDALAEEMEVEERGR